MEIRTVHIDQLNPAAYNPRKNLRPEDAQYQSLQRSMKEFGYIDPIVWNERTGNVVGGHQRLKILADEGAKEIDVSAVDLDDTQEKALNIALNKISGSWDMEKLNVLFQDIQGELSDISITGFSSIEVGDLLEGNAIDIDSLFASAPPKADKPGEPEQIQCPHCSKWFEVDEV